MQLRSAVCSYCSRRYSWTSRMAVAPSPTAAATRLTEPWRMSPAANTPGRLVSSSSGGRFGGQSGGWFAVAEHATAGQQESAVVPLDGGGQPVGVGFGADQDEQRARRQGFCARGGPVLDGERL